MMSAHLFISHFKSKYKKCALCILEVAACALCIILTEKLLDYMLVSEDGFTQQLMTDFYHMEDNVDNIYLGSSHVHYNIKPEILDAVSGENNYNLATGLQPMNTSYYLLKEASKENRISHVYLELSCGLTTGEYGKIKTYEQLPNSWRVLDYVNPSFNKLQWMLDISEPKYYYLSFFPSRRYYKEFLDGAYIAGQLQNKAANEETKWKGGYVYKGYRHTEAVIDGMYCQKGKSVSFDENPITDEVIEYLIRIIDFCKKNEIGLTLFTSPITDCELYNFENYDFWGNQIRKLAIESGVNYYDFNLCKTEYLDLSDEHNWREHNHLNTWGAEIYTQFLGQVFEEEKSGTSDVEQYFYNDYQQKLQCMGETLFGLTIEEIQGEEKLEYLGNADIDREDEGLYKIFCVSAVDNYEGNDRVEYSFSLIDEERGFEQLIQNWDENAVCIVPLDDVDKVLGIEVRKKGAVDKTDSRNYKVCKIVLGE